MEERVEKKWADLSLRPGVGRQKTNTNKKVLYLANWQAGPGSTTQKEKRPANYWVNLYWVRRGKDEGNLQIMKEIGRKVKEGFPRGTELTGDY